MRPALLLSAVSLLAASPSESLATSYDVRQDGNGDFTTIAGALAVATLGDSVLVHAGTYLETGLAPQGGVTVRGAESDPAAVVVGRNPDENAFDVGASLPVRIENLRITECRWGISVFPVGNVRVDGCRIDSCSTGVGATGTSTFHVESSSITECTQGVFTASSAVIGVLVVGTTIASNTRALNVGNGSATVEDCVIADNGVSGSGAVIVQDDDSALFRRVRFERNRPRAVWAKFRADALFEDCVFEDNGQPDADGAALVADGASVDLVGCSFLDNTSSRGAVHVYAQGIVTATGCSFRGNGAAATGGALHVGEESSGSGGRLVLVDSDVVGNVSGVSGAGIHVTQGELLVQGSTIAGNSAQIGAGISAAGPASLVIEGSVVALNTGQIHIEPDTDLILECTNVYPLDPANLSVLAALAGPGNRSGDPAFCEPFWQGLTVRDNSLNLAPPMCAGIFLGLEGAACPPAGVYVLTSPPGLVLSIDGEASVGGRYFPAPAPPVLQVHAPSPQTPAPGMRYTYFGWSDGGDQSHDAAYSSWTETVTATFSAEFELTTATSGDGTVSPAGGWFDSGDSVLLEATPGPGQAFLYWNGEGLSSYTGPANPIVVVMNSPVYQTAVFAPAATVRIESEPSGAVVEVDSESYMTPLEFEWQVGSAHTVSVDSLQIVSPGHRLRYGSWSGGLARSHSFIVQTNDLQTVFLETDYELTFEPESFGVVTPGNGWYPAGTGVTIQAVADPGLDFVRWYGMGVGSYSGPANPAQVTLNGPVHQDAVFVTTAVGGFDLALSASDTDPFQHVGAPTDSARVVYLWLTCSALGASALEAAVETDLTVFGFAPAEGVLNAGTATELLLAIGGCPEGPAVNRLLGSWTLWDTGGSLCLGPSVGNGWIGVVDCDPLNAQLHEDPHVFGFASAGVPCDRGLNGCESGPIVVRLSNLRVEAGDRAVYVRWETALEVDHAGFHVYRARHPDGPWTRRTQDLHRGTSPYEWVDRSTEGDATYYYAVGAVDTGGAEERYGPVEVKTPRWTTLVTALAPVRPNPFRSRAEIAFSLASAGPARISIFDVAGRLVRVVTDGSLPAGDHLVPWDGRDAGGLVVPAGVYFSRLEAAGVTETRKIVRLGVR